MSSADKTDLGYVPALALFDKPSVNTGIISHKWIQYDSINPVSSGALQFIIPGTSNSYINLKCSTLQIQGKILKENGSEISEDEFVSLVNAPLQSLWSQVDLKLQQKIVNSGVGTDYAYKAYLDLLLNQGTIQQSFQLSSQLFILDPAGDMDNVDRPQGGMRLRGRHTAKSRLIQMEAPLLLDLCQQDRYILNGVEVNLRFWPNKEAFYLLAPNGSDKYMFKMSSAHLNVCTAEISPAILVGHAEALKIAPAVYPFFQSEIKSFSLSEGLLQYTANELFQGEIPSEILVGLVSATAYSGDYVKNPFNFQHYNCNFAGFYVNGNSVPRQELQPKFKNSENNRGKRAIGVKPRGPNKKKRNSGTGDAGDSTGKEGTETEKEEEVGEIPQARNVDDSEAYTEAYLSLFGHEYDSIDTIPINMERYANGYCLYKFQINKNIESDDYLSVSRRGTTRLTLKFNKPLPESVIALVYAKFPRVLQIDQARNIIL